MVKTLLSAGRKCPAGRPPSPGLNEAAAPGRWRKCGGTASCPFSPALPRDHDDALFFRGLELVTGGQRLHRHEDYLAALAARGEPAAPYAGYLRAFAHGMPPHGGFALGLERWTARLTGADNIRRTTLFPRDLHRLTP